LGLFALRASHDENLGDLEVYHRVVARLGDGLDLYQYAETDQPDRVTGYIYPPPFAFAFYPLTKLPFPLLRGLWFFLMGLCAARSVWIGVDLVRQGRAPPLRPRLALLLALPVVVRFAWSDLGHGQVNLLVIWLTLEGVWRAERGRDLPAAAFLAAAVVLKVTPAIVVAGYLLQRRLRLVGAAVGIGVGILLAPALVLGVGGNVDACLRFVTVATRWNADAHAYVYNNVTLAAVAQRLLVGAGNPGYPPEPILLSAPPALAHAVARGVSVLMFVGSLAWTRALPPARRAAVLLCAIPLISPIAWKPHLVCLILPALLAADDLVRQGARRAWPQLVGLLLLGAAGRVPLGKYLAGSITLWGGTALGMLLMAAGLIWWRPGADPRGEAGAGAPPNPEEINPGQPLSPPPGVEAQPEPPATA
jgi:hypothetical protein